MSNQMLSPVVRIVDDDASVCREFPAVSYSRRQEAR